VCTNEGGAVWIKREKKKEKVECKNDNFIFKCCVKILKLPKQQLQSTLMNKKYQVFISSTYLDLKDERKKVANAIFKSDHIPVGMEVFPASTLRQWEMIKELIDTSDYYILIVGGRYGSISNQLDNDDKREISYTQQEYEYAYKKGIPIYSFFRSAMENLPDEMKEKTDKNKKRLDAFKKIIKNNGYYYESWDNADELSRKVLNSLTHGYSDVPRPGWIRADKLSEIANDYNSNVELKEKLIYYKFLHLSNQDENQEPIYQKHIKRLKKDISIWDEYITFRVSSFDKLVKKFKSYDSTKGSAVEVNSLLPFVLSLRDTDITAEENPQIVQPLIIGPSNVYITSSHYYNGFQKRNRDAAVKADKAALTLRLLVDFTSIKDFNRFIVEKPKVFFSYHDLNNGKLVSKILGDATEITKGLYYAEKNNANEGDVLRIEFADDFDEISNIS
jgi:hypothetical protein